MTDGSVVLYVATSLDGFLADEDGGVEWLASFEGADDGGHESGEAGDGSGEVGDGSGEAGDGSGGVDGGSEPTDEPPAPDGYEAFLAGVDCLLVGSRTYEQVLSFGEWPYGDLPTIVLTTRDLPRATPAVEFVAGDVGEVARDLRGQHGTVWLVGGAAVAQSALRAGAVDEIRLTVVPTLLGGGIHLFDDAAGAHGLDLLGTATHAGGLVELRYAVGP